MKKRLILSLLFFKLLNVYSQTIIFDPGHFAIVNESGAVRLAAENTHNNYLNTIRNRLDDINLNISSVVLVQTLIHNSLTQVNQALKSGIAAAQVAHISAEIIRESNAMIVEAGTEHRCRYQSNDPCIYNHKVNRFNISVNFRATLVGTVTGKQVIMNGQWNGVDYTDMNIEVRSVNLLTGAVTP